MGGFIVLPISREAMTLSRNYFLIAEFTVNRRCAVVIIRKQRMPVVDRYGHFGGVARFVGNNYFLLTVCRRENKAAVFIERDRRSVYGDGICILLVNCNRLRFAVGLAVLNTADYRRNIIKRYAVGTKVCYVQTLVNKHCINNIFSVGFYAERLIIRTVHKRAQLLFGEILICYQIGDKHNSAVIGGVYRYLLRILKEQTGGKLVKKFAPFICAYDNFARRLFGIFPFRF